MNIRDTSLLYRYANWVRDDDAPPFKDGCELFTYALIPTIIIALLLGVGLLFSFAVGAVGAMVLASFDIAEPANLILAVLMAFGTGVALTGSIVPAFYIARFLSSRIVIEHPAGGDVSARRFTVTVSKSSRLYRYASKGRDTAEDGEISSGGDLVCAVIGRTFLYACVGLLGGTLTAGIGLITIDTFFASLLPETANIPLVMSLAVGSVVFLGLAALVWIARKACMKTTIEVTQKS
jgi:hypothetical protein